TQALQHRLSVFASRNHLCRYNRGTTGHYRATHHATAKGYLIMSTQDDTLQPEEFSEAAAAAITDAFGRSFRDTSHALAASGLLGVCAPECSGGLGLGLEFAVPIAEAAGKLYLHFPLVEQILLAKAFADT